MGTRLNLREECDGCGVAELREFNISASPIKIDALSSKDFTVTNKDYGTAVETVRCQSCGLIQPKYIFEFKDIVHFYAGVEDESYLSTATNRGESNFVQVQRVISKYAPMAKSVIEIGSGSGTLVHLLSEKYEKVTGVEPSDSFVKFAKSEYDLDLINSGYEELNGGKYDVVIALDVIEHVVSPHHFLTKVSELLNSNGIAIIGTPDVDGISSKILRKKWYHIRPPHLYYFSKRSFAALCKVVGLKIVTQKYFSWSLPFEYLADSVQKLVLKRSLVHIRLPFVKNVKVNLFDSRLYVIKKLSN